MKKLLSHCVLGLILVLALGGWRSAEATQSSGASAAALQKIDASATTGTKAAPAKDAGPEAQPWDKLSALAAVASLVVSVLALGAAVLGTRSSTRLATEALETARQANNIALGLVREPAIVEFAFPNSNAERFSFDFVIPGSLTEEFQKIITVKNVGKKSVDSIAFEIIGITGLTYPSSDPAQDIRPLPFIDARLDLKTAIQPAGLANIDVRRYLLEYLKKLEPALQHQEAEYTTVINVVMAPKAVDEPVHAGIPGHLTTNAQRIVTIRFVPAILASTEAQAVLQDPNVAHRVFDY